MMKANGKTSKPFLWRLTASERRIILITGDLLVTAIALLAALYFWARLDWLNFSWEFLRTRPPLWFYLMPVVWLVLLVDLYDIRRASHPIDTLKGIAIAAGIYLGIYLIFYFFTEPNSLPRRGFLAFILVTSILTEIWRLIYIRVFTAPVFMRRVLIVGAGRAGSALARVVSQMEPKPFHIVGFIDDDRTKTNMMIESYPILGSCAQLQKTIEQEHVSDIIFAISGEMSPEMFQALQKATEQGVEITTMPIVYEELIGRVPILLLQSDWLVRSFVDQVRASGIYEIMKRILDLAGGLVGTVIFMFLSPFIAAAIALDTGRPILYKQIRLGKNGREYPIIKFRTMRKDAEKDGIARPATQNDDRITRVGYILRKSHMDELPQFLSILRGDMSLVGPRAERRELVEELQNRVPFYRARLLVKPGLTGWAQINFGYAATVEDTTIKLEYDLYYIKHRNIFLDFMIILRTVGHVVGFRGQ
jgi:exopolysaccharide biosynthesis polyprenyl glycosylphosphotransferase